MDEELTIPQGDDNVAQAPITDTPGNTGNEGIAAPTPSHTEDDLPASVREYLAQNPNAQEAVDLINREMKAAWTPKLQEAAELRKRFDGLDESVVQAVRHLQTLAQNDPKNAAHYLRQQAELLDGPQGQGQTVTPTNAADPYANLVPASDVEELLLNKFRAMEQQLQQQQMQQKVVAVRSEFASLQKELGVEIPVEAQAKAWEFSEKSGGQISVSDAFFALNRTTLLPSLIQKAKDEASGIVERKAAGSAPGVIATRGGPAPSTGPKDFDTLLAEEIARRRG